jgi:serine/threonine protein kinase
MLNIIDYLHSQGHVHRDLKLENFMINDLFKLQLIDYGMAAPIEGRDGYGFLFTILGTEFY